MMPTALNLFFVQCLLEPVRDPNAWKKFVKRAGYQKTRVTTLERLQEQYDADPDKFRLRRRDFSERNPEKVRANNAEQYAVSKEQNLARTAAWREENPKKVRGYAISRDKKVSREYVRKRRAESPEFRLVCNLRSRIQKAVVGKTKSAKSFALLGMEIPEYRIYLQGQFRPGMSWDNYGSAWEIDHIRPCASFDLSDPAQQRECFNWSNTQPLFAEENLRKGAHF